MASTDVSQDVEDFDARAHRLYETGRTLDKERYTSREFAEREREKVWKRTWQLACRESEVANVGDFSVHEVAGESVLVIRETTGRLRALSNVCRHRATHLKKSTGSVAELRCPFHGWKYALNGELLEIPNDWDFPHIDRAQLCLPEFGVDTWQGYVFVNLDPDAPPLLEFLAPLPEHFADCHFESSFRMFATRIVMPCNWKLAYAAFVESYHSPWTHPQTIEGTNDVLSDYDLFGSHGRMIVRSGPSPHLQPPPTDEALVEGILAMRAAMGGGADLDAGELKAAVAAGKAPRTVLEEVRRADAAARGTDTSWMNESQVVDTWCYNIFPNMIAFTSMVGMGFYSRFAPYGDGPDQSIMEVCVMAPVAVGAAERPPDVPFREITADQIPDVFGEVGLGELFGQDVRNLRTVQRGLESDYFGGINLALYQEALPRHLEEMIDKYLAR
jgi:phenylpropionate dioxygenase-like ring-hydroxylating dioxygenase large terminal subunit